MRYKIEMERVGNRFSSYSAANGQPPREAAARHPTLSLAITSTDLGDTA